MDKRTYFSSYFFFVLLLPLLNLPPVLGLIPIFRSTAATYAEARFLEMPFFLATAAAALPNDLYFFFPRRAGIANSSIRMEGGKSKLFKPTPLPFQSLVTMTEESILSTDKKVRLSNTNAEKMIH